MTKSQAMQGFKIVKHKLCSNTLNRVTFHVIYTLCKYLTIHRSNMDRISVKSNIYKQTSTCTHKYLKNQGLKKFTILF